MYNEFSLIKKITERIKGLNNTRQTLIVPPGDDAALLSAISQPVISTDCHREGVHFRLDWQTPAEIGFKAVSVTLSDLAASYAEPVCLFVNLGLSAICDEDLVMELYDGIIEALTLYPCALGGGNISFSPELSLDLFAIGEGHPGSFPLRTNAREKEGLYSTGPLGEARAGLKVLEQHIKGYDELMRRFKKPSARFDAAHILRDHHVSCVMDISDGLCGDASHIAKASNISIRFTLEEILLSPELIRFCNKYGHSALDMALAGGEDYELLFTCAPHVFESIRSFLPEAIPVGECLPFNGSWIINPPESPSYVHRV